MGRDISFVDPASLPAGEDDEVYNYETRHRLGCQHGNLRLIDWFPYSRLGLTEDLGAFADCTITEFIKYLEDLYVWIHENARKYKYYSKPIYGWHEEYFDDKYIMFGEIKTIETPECPPDPYVVDCESPCILKHHVYWTEQRPLDKISMLSDARIVREFIDELKSLQIPPDWIVKMH